MSRRQIIIEIDAEDEQCGECGGAWLGGYDAECEEQGRKDGHWVRGPACLAAEEKLRALVEAGNELSDALPGDETSVNGDRRNQWDRALAAVKGGAMSCTEPCSEKPCMNCRYERYDSIDDESYCTHGPEADCVGFLGLVTKWGTCEYWEKR